MSGQTRRPLLARTDCASPSAFAPKRTFSSPGPLGQTRPPCSRASRDARRSSPLSRALCAIADRSDRTAKVLSAATCASWRAPIARVMVVTPRGAQSPSRRRTHSRVAAEPTSAKRTLCARFAIAQPARSRHRGALRARHSLADARHSRKSSCPPGCKSGPSRPGRRDANP